MGGGVAVSVKGGWAIHKRCYTPVVERFTVVVPLPYYCCCCRIKQDVCGVGCKCTMQLLIRWQFAAFRVKSLKSGNMAPDNQVVCLPCILHFMQTKPHIISSRDASCTLRNLDLFFTNDLYVRIDLLNLFFNAPRTCCCWWLCLEVKTQQKTVRTRGFVRFINTAVHRRETVE